MKFISFVIFFSMFASAVLAGTPTGHPPMDHKAMMDKITDGEAVSESDMKQQGKAVSVLPVSGYVYIEVAPAEGENIWMAVPEGVVVKEGDTVHYNDGPMMTDFTSKTLDRTFPSVMFLGKVVVTSGEK